MDNFRLAGIRRDVTESPEVKLEIGLVPTTMPKFKEE